MEPVSRCRLMQVDVVLQQNTLLASRGHKAAAAVANCFPDSSRAALSKALQLNAAWIKQGALYW
jgi:hypothetical protein